MSFPRPPSFSLRRSRRCPFSRKLAARGASALFLAGFSAPLFWMFLNAQKKEKTTPKKYYMRGPPFQRRFCRGHLRELVFLLGAGDGPFTYIFGQAVFLQKKRSRRSAAFPANS